MSISIAVRGLMAACAMAGSSTAFGQAFPARAMTVVMPLSPSTAFYVAMRQMADQIQAKVGKPVVLDPAVGAGGTLSPQRIKRADPDGYTIGLVYAAPLTVNPYVEKEPRYDPLKDFAYITMLTRHGILFAAGPKVPANNLQELIALAKSRPGGVKVGEGATGSRIGLLQLQEAGGVQFLDVPYKSSAEFDAALLSGEVDVVLSTVGTELGQIRGGRAKGIAIGSRNRSPLLPNVQSISEVYPNVEVISWYALFAPAGTPNDRIDWLHREWTAALKDPKIVERMQTVFGYEIVASTPQEVLDQIKREIPINSRIAKQYGISE
ncbi:MAG TPA: tripartite tricarboxylate transporter substrate binding protein [Burkholderiales bacterium]|nr:tripartite tricarboxylate transporter substrate binding protein [Burkholderiales bacterium]